MAIIECDIRRGRTKEQIQMLTREITRVVTEITGTPREHVFFVIRELPGFNFVEFGEHLVDYQPGPDGRDVAGEAQLRRLGAITD